MAPKATNRDLYLAIAGLVKRESNSERSLEHYLSVLWSIACPFKNSASIALPQFFSLLDQAFTAPIPTFDPSWLSRYTTHSDESDFVGWETTILGQIVDLHEMAENGTLDNEFRYFGTSSPRGGYWYNFDPRSFLECAAAGTIGGWQPEDDTGRKYVPGLVATLDIDGNIVSKNPEDIPNPVVALTDFTWDGFRDFLYCGQHYE